MARVADTSLPTPVGTDLAKTHPATEAAGIPTTRIRTWRMPFSDKDAYCVGTGLGHVPKDHRSPRPNRRYHGIYTRISQKVPYPFGVLLPAPSGSCGREMRAEDLNPSVLARHAALSADCVDAANPLVAGAVPTAALCAGAFTRASSGRRRARSNPGCAPPPRGGRRGR
jgi:hypothetical protein